MGGFARKFSVCVLAMLLLPQAAYVQQQAGANGGAGAQQSQFHVSLVSKELAPTFTEMVYLKVSVGSDSTYLDWLDKPQDPEQKQREPTWCPTASSFTVTGTYRESGASSARSAKTFDLKVLRIWYAGIDSKERNCTAVDVYVSANIKNASQVQVSIKGPKPDENIEVGPEVAVPYGTGRQVSFSMSAQSATSEKLTNGNSRAVGQFKVDLSVPYVGHTPVGTMFIKSAKNVFSTDAKDVNSAFDAQLGTKNVLPLAWYWPWSAQVEMKGDQVAKNLSFFTGAQMNTLIPWKNAKPALYNQAIKAPISPELSLSVLYERRLRQTASNAAKYPNLDAVQLNPAMSWTLISLAPGFWDKITGRSSTDKPASEQQKNLAVGMEMDWGAYYLPTDKTKSGTGTQIFEGYGDVSLLIPLPLLQHFIPGAGFLNSSTDPVNSQIRIKYSDAVNSAQGYARTKQWTYGIELMSGKK